MNFTSLLAVSDKNHYQHNEVGNIRKLIKLLDMDEVVKLYLDTYSIGQISEEKLEEVKKHLHKAISWLDPKFSKDDYMMLNGKSLHPRWIGVELLLARGNLTRCAINLSVRRNRLEEWVQKNENTQMLYNEVQEMVMDWVEDKLLELIGNGDRGAISYYLNCKGQFRGYGTYEQRRAVGKIVEKSKMTLDKDEEFKIKKMKTEE